MQMALILLVPSFRVKTTPLKFSTNEGMGLSHNLWYGKSWKNHCPMLCILQGMMKFSYVIYVNELVKIEVPEVDFMMGRL